MLILSPVISALFAPEGSGDIKLISNNGAINTGAIFSFSQGGNAGDITLDAANDINTSHISAWGDLRGGNITIDAGDEFNMSDFDIGDATINSFSENGNAGDVEITTSGDTNLGGDVGGDTSRDAIRSEGLEQGGNITIRSSGNLDAAGDFTVLFQNRELVVMFT
jgi:hypothetical protein